MSTLPLNNGGGSDSSKLHNLKCSHFIRYFPVPSIKEMQQSLEREPLWFPIYKCTHTAFGDVCSKQGQMLLLRTKLFCFISRKTIKLLGRQIYILSKRVTTVQTAGEIIVQCFQCSLSTNSECAGVQKDVHIHICDFCKYILFRLGTFLNKK